MKRSALLALPVFFGMKVLAGLVLLKLSAAFLPVAGFSIFSQFLLFAALLNMLAIGGAQTGVIRQIAAATTADDHARVRNAGFAIWGGAIALLGIPSMVLARPIAQFLTGEPALWWVVPAVTLTSLLSGPGQIYCSMLTGFGRTAASLSAQALGFAASTVGATIGLLHHDAAGAVIAFSAGPLATLLAAGWMVRRHRVPRGSFGHVAAEVRVLIGYSGAFAILAILNAAIPFALRYYYREAFGAEQLGYWMAASRVSDTSTQLMGLYLIQLFMPRYAAAGAQERERALRESWLAASGIMLGFLIVFAVASQLLVRLFLSRSFLPAIPFIFGYMIGDVFRATVATAMYASFARARLTRYVAMEAGALSLFGLIMIALIHLGRVDAPMIAYPLAYVLFAVTIWTAHAAVRLRRPRPESSAQSADG
jgi:O-antigen/teichoic acid export membrane protein